MTSTEGKPKQFCKKCYFCSKDFHKRELCLAKNVTCNNCGKKGHLKAACKSSKVHEVQSDEMPSTFENSIFWELSLTLEGIRGVNLTPPLDFFGLKVLFLDRLPKALAQLFFVC